MNLLHHSNKKKKKPKRKQELRRPLSLCFTSSYSLAWENNVPEGSNRHQKRAFGQAVAYFKTHTLIFFIFFSFTGRLEFLWTVHALLPDTQAAHSTVQHTHTHTHSPGTLPRCHRRLLPHLSGSVNGPSQVWKPLPRPLSSSLPPFPHVPLPPPFIPSFPPTTSFSVQTVKRKCVNLHGGQRLTLSPRPVQLSAFLRAEQKWMNEWIDVFGWWKLLPGHNCQGDAQLRWNMQNASILRKSSVFYLDCHGCSGKFHLLSV